MTPLTTITRLLSSACYSRLHSIYYWDVICEVVTVKCEVVYTIQVVQCALGYYNGSAFWTGPIYTSTSSYVLSVECGCWRISLIKPILLLYTITH